MGRKRSPGLRKRGGIWHIEKQILNHKIHESTGASGLAAAEVILARRIEEIRQAKIFGVRPRRMFREAAAKVLEENLHLASIGDYAMHLQQLDAHIGNLPLENVHLGTLHPGAKGTGYQDQEHQPCVERREAHSEPGGKVVARRKRPDLAADAAADPNAPGHRCP